MVSLLIVIISIGCFRSLKQYDESIRNLNIAIKLIKDNYGDNNLPIASIYNNLGMTLKDQLKYDEALSYYLKALNIRNEMLDKNHPEIVAVRHNIGNNF